MVVLVSPHCASFHTFGVRAVAFTYTLTLILADDSPPGASLQTIDECMFSFFAYPIVRSGTPAQATARPVAAVAAKAAVESENALEEWVDGDPVRTQEGSQEDYQARQVPSTCIVLLCCCRRETFQSFRIRFLNSGKASPYVRPACCYILLPRSANHTVPPLECAY